MSRLGSSGRLGETAGNAVKLAVYQNLRDAQPEFDYTVVLNDRDAHVNHGRVLTTRYRWREA